jgi:hypothetical protein
MRVSALPLAALATLTLSGTLSGCKGCGKAEDTDDPGPIGEDPPVGDPHDIGSWLSMKVMPDGRPAVAYYDRTSDALGFAIGTIKDGAVTWATEEVDSYPDENGLNPGDAGKYASMAIASDGTVWIVYQDSSNGALKYAKRDTAAAWTVAVADVGASPGMDAGYWATIALDPSGNPVAAHYDNKAGAVRIAHWNGSAFTGEVVYEGTDYTPADTGAATVTGQAGEYAKLAIAADGTEYLAFYDRAWGALRLASGRAGSYGVEIVDETGDVGQWPDLLVDGADVTIAYHDVGNQDLKIARGRAGGGWTTEVVDDGDHVGADIALYDNGSDPGILYSDAANNDLKLARMSSGSWARDTVGGTGAALGYHNETVDIGGTRYVACYDYTARSIWFSALP